MLAVGTTSTAALQHRHTSQAKVSMAKARATALARVPHGTIRSSELEREHGKLIYSFDIKVPGKSGIDEVNIDAMNGSVIAVTHEGPRAERAEAAKDKAEAQRARAKTK
jgi:uncharacterized membrane protein YkoI